MTKLRGLVVSSIVALFTVVVVGCGGFPSDEQLEAINKLDQEVQALKTKVADLNKQKADLQREVQEKQAKLDQCANDMEETKANLEKLPQ